MDREDIIRRWRSNAAAAGVRLTDEDIERIIGLGALDRINAVQQIVGRANAREVIPDYLSVLTGGPSSE